MKHIKVCEQIPIRHFGNICGKLCEAESGYMQTNRGTMKGDIDSKNTAVQNLVNYGGFATANKLGLLNSDRRLMTNTKN